MRTSCRPCELDHQPTISTAIAPKLASWQRMAKGTDDVKLRLERETQSWRNRRSSTQQ